MARKLSEIGVVVTIILLIVTAATNFFAVHMSMQNMEARRVATNRLEAEIISNGRGVESLGERIDRLEIRIGKQP